MKTPTDIPHHRDADNPPVLRMNVKVLSDAVLSRVQTR